MSTLATFNGVDTSRIAALSNKIQEEPAQGDTLWKAEVIWQNGFRNQIRIRDLPASYADEPEALGGTNTAPTQSDASKPGAVHFFTTWPEIGGLQEGQPSDFVGVLRNFVGGLLPTVQKMNRTRCFGDN